MNLIKAPRPDLIYPATVAFDDGRHVVVVATRILPPADIGPARFETGDRFVEHYWRDQWWAIYEVCDSDDNLKGWYGSICEPVEVADGVLDSRDLYLDVWLSADRSFVTRLDEDEFVASGLADREPEIASAALDAFNELVQMMPSGLDELLAFG